MSVDQASLASFSLTRTLGVGIGKHPFVLEYPVIPSLLCRKLNTDLTPNWYFFSLTLVISLLTLKLHFHFPEILKRGHKKANISALRVCQPLDFLRAREYAMSIYMVTTKDENSAGALSPACSGRGQSPYPMVG